MFFRQKTQQLFAVKCVAQIEIRSKPASSRRRHISQPVRCLDWQWRPRCVDGGSRIAADGVFAPKAPHPPPREGEEAAASPERGFGLFDARGLDSDGDDGRHRTPLAVADRSVIDQHELEEERLDPTPTRGRGCKAHQAGFLRRVAAKMTIEQAAQRVPVQMHVVSDQDGGVAWQPREPAQHPNARQSWPTRS